MEAFAFLKLCEHTNVQSLGVVKGVSDYGDSDKGGDETAYDDALAETGKALKRWIRHLLDKVPFTRDEGKSYLFVAQN